MFATKLNNNITIMHKHNKDICGYQLLCMLSQSDGFFAPEEGNIIVDYILKNFPLGGNLENALEEISTLTEKDYMFFYEKVANDFFDESTHKERTEFLRFAMKLINADEKVVREEDTMISKLFDWWGL
ncbi:MAG: TerB family tellurite resistance protein [Bacteroidia bacterium]|nr:TerB family tellurite resistance protein [Bacteroidia bacterium]